MLNKPTHTLKDQNWPSVMAGEKFPRDEQCKLVFGPNSRICTYMVSRPISLNVDR